MNLQRIASSLLVAPLFAFALVGCIGSTSSSGGTDPQHEPSHSDGGPTPIDPVEPVADAGPDSPDPQGFDGCGVAPVADPDGGVVLVGDGGVAMVGNVPIGSSASLVITVEDTADVSETILGGWLAGSGGTFFSISSTFPIAVPAGQPAQIAIEFAPTAAGTYSAQLQLQTMKMGVSTITLTATATAGE
jgi:hypothetical protein